MKSIFDSLGVKILIANKKLIPILKLQKRYFFSAKLIVMLV